MSLSRTEAKVTIAKLIEVAYSKDKGLTTKIMAQKGIAKLTVDQNGNATLSGSAGFLTFSGTTVLEKIGVKIKRVSVNFTNEGKMRVGYTATFNLGYLDLSIAGTFNLEDLMLSCSGLLCRATRALKGRPDAIENQMKVIMGG